MQDDLEQAETRIRLGDFHGALAMLQGKTDVSALILRGECQEYIGDREGATQTWASLPHSAASRLLAGRAEAARGRYAMAREHLRSGVDLVRSQAERFADPGRLLHDLLLVWSEVAYRMEDRAAGERLLGEAARAWPGSPYSAALLARRASDAEAARRLLATALARIPPEDLADFLTRESAVAGDLPHGPAILEILLAHGLNRASYDRALNAWHARHPLPG